MFEQVGSLLGNIASLLWPVAVIVALVMFRAPLLRRLESLTSVKFLGAELSFAIYQLAEAQPPTATASGKDRRGAVARAANASPRCEGRRVLWVDDNPDQNRSLAATIEALLGIEFDFATDTEAALRVLHETRVPDAVITDMRRGDDTQAGIRLVDTMRAEGIHRPTVVYLSQLDDAPTPAGVFRITNRPDELLHSIVDICERAYWR